MAGSSTPRSAGATDEGLWGTSLALCFRGPSLSPQGPLSAPPAANPPGATGRARRGHMSCLPGLPDGRTDWQMATRLPLPGPSALTDRVTETETDVGKRDWFLPFALKTIDLLIGNSRNLFWTRTEPQLWSKCNQNVRSCSQEIRKWERKSLGAGGLNQRDCSFNGEVITLITETLFKKI